MNNKVLFYVFLVVCSIIPISTQSLWIDEAWTIIDYALQPSFGELISSLWNTKGGDSQFAGYNIYMWLWVRVFGISEFAVRSANLPFFLLTLFYIYFYLPRTSSFKIGFLLLISFSPFIWFYLNESRYIIPVFSFSMLALVAVINYFEEPGSDKRLAVFVLLSSIILGVAFMMLYVFALIPLAFIIFFYVKERGESFKELFTKWKIPLFVSFALLAVIGTYYMLTIIRGAGGTRLNPDIRNIVFVLYDFMGFAGIGPSRDALRESLEVDTKSIYFLRIVMFSVIHLGFLLMIVLNLRRTKPNKLAFYGLAGVLVSMTLFFIFAEFFHFKFLGRHVVFIYPGFLFFYYTLLYDAFQRYKKVGIFLGVLFFAALLYSNYNLRFNEDYQKTNHLKGCRVAAREAKGEKLLWLADKHAFDYYVILRKQVEGIDPQNVTFVNGKTDKKILKEIVAPLKNDRFFVVVVNRKDYNQLIQNYLFSLSYQIVYKDKDFTMYR